MLKASKKMRGFTLVELMVTLAVLAIIIAIAIPNMSTFTKKQAVRSTADELLLSMVYARSEALKANQSIYILPAAGGWSSGWCVSKGAACSGTQLLRSFIPSGKNLKFSGFGAQIKFNGKGIRDVGSTDYSVEDETLPAADKRCIKLHKTGRAAMADC